MRRTSAIAATVPLLLALAAAVQAGDGVYDPSFGDHALGVSIVDVFANPQMSVDEANAVVALPDGSLLLGGSSLYDFSLPKAISLVRLDAYGRRDASFGNGGASLIDPGPDIALMDLVTVLRRAGGRLLALGYGMRAGAVVLVLCRADADGLADGGCLVLLPPPDTLFGSGRMAASLDREDRLVTAAPVGTPVFSYNVDLSVARWHVDGTPDTGFGHGGATTITRFDELAGQSTREVVAGLAVDAEGRIVVAASSQPRGPAGDGNAVFAVARLLASGQVDGSFGDGGVRTVPAATPFIEARALALSDDGGIVVGGTARVADSPAWRSECTVARLDADGELDAGFGSAGLRSVAFHGDSARDEGCTSLTTQPDGRIVVAGYARAPGESGGFDLAAARLWPDGRIDAGFGNTDTGRFIGAIDLDPESGNHDRIDAILWHDDRLVASGTTISGYDQEEFVAIRLRADGLLDDGFDRR